MDMTEERRAGQEWGEDKDTQDDSVSSDTGRRPYRVALTLARLGNKIN